MARTRYIKQGFFTNEQLADCDPLARLLFAGLWLIADREGRLEDRPRKIKAETLPYDNCDADKLLDDLQSANFIERYEVAGTKYIQILNFAKHQHPHPKEAPSAIPSAEKDKVEPDVSTAVNGKNRESHVISGKDRDEPGNNFNSNGNYNSNTSPSGESTRAREDEKYPDWLVENEAVRMLWRQFRPEEAIPIGVQEKIAFEVTDLALWRDEVLDFWVENSHRPTSYRKMWARYRELVAKRERESSQPQARDPDHWRKHYAAELRKWLRHPMNDEQKQAVERALADLPKLSRDEWSERRGELEDLDILIV